LQFFYESLELLMEIDKYRCFDRRQDQFYRIGKIFDNSKIETEIEQERLFRNSLGNEVHISSSITVILDILIALKTRMRCQSISFLYSQDYF
jgi:hypothetical protein